MLEISSLSLLFLPWIVVFPFCFRINAFFTQLYSICSFLLLVGHVFSLSLSLFFKPWIVVFPFCLRIHDFFTQLYSICNFLMLVGNVFSLSPFLPRVEIPGFCFALVSDSVDVTGRSLGHDHEQSLESVHADFDKVWSRYRVLDTTSPTYPTQLLSSVLNLNASHAPS